MNLAHLHLLLNHFPTIGFIIGLTLYVAGLYAKSDHIKQSALVVFVGIALITIPTYVTGNAAEHGPADEHHADGDRQAGAGELAIDPARPASQRRRRLHTSSMPVICCGERASSRPLTTATP